MPRKQITQQTDANVASHFEAKSRQELELQARIVEYDTLSAYPNN